MTYNQKIIKNKVGEEVERKPIGGSKGWSKPIPICFGTGKSGLPIGCRNPVRKKFKIFVLFSF